MTDITLEQLYEMQKEFDARIIKEKGLEGQDLLPNTVLALQVEIAELANEWRGFKHWSNDRRPRYSVLEVGGKCGEERVVNRVLEEYVDSLHCFLSIANQLDLTADDLYVPESELEGETATIFTELLHLVGMIVGHKMLIKPPADIKQHQKRFFRAALGTFYELGEQRFGFTFEQIAEAYLEKNKINHQRQDNGY